jgi:type I restriction enzyme M protein
MLDAETKARIDSARDILVGKVPDPKSQVEQITIALIYKFMDDMDRQSEEIGGKVTFFSGEYKKYTWSKLLDKKIGGQERLLFYAEGIEKMNENKNIPQLFRDIFKGAFLPYRDPETLNLFLKEINGFTYDHSERLGDAFEYLLSVLSSQGDAGQFRTPRHIIDFIVQIVDPKKNETVLDPACGTAGFLISSYKHILAQNTKDRSGDQLSVDEKDRLMTNFCGYDISPDMVRLSRVNMYLHSFANPRIHEYDTLTSEERWDERYDVILANPPFMTPKGGIRPHNRFSIKAKRSEVLFVDYIAEHLNVNGRAGVIVPEGIIFQSQNAYKTLRKMLVENYLWCVVSLPAGCFNPYSGVKTSVLLMDKSLTKRIDEILFVKIENDGFDLGAQRRPIEKNDLPEALRAIADFRLQIAELKRDDIANQKPHIENQKFQFHTVKKSRILESGDCNLSGDRYRDTGVRVSGQWPMVRLGEVCEFMTGGTPTSSVKGYWENGTVPWLVSGDIHKGEIFDCDGRITIKGVQNSNAKYLPKDSVLIALNGQGKTRGAVAILRMENATCNQSIVSINPVNKNILLSEFVFYQLKSMYQAIRNITGDSQRSGLNIPIIKTIRIPLPPLDVQEKIVAELNGYRKIIEGARQILASYKPSIRIDPEWPRMKLGDICDIKSGGTPNTSRKEYYENGSIPWLKSEVCKDSIIDQPTGFITEAGLENSSAKFFKPNTTLIALVGATIGKTALATFETTTNQNVVGLFPVDLKMLDPRYLFYITQTLYQNFLSLGDGNFKMANLSFVKAQKIPLPPLDVQHRIVAELDEERKLVEANRKLIEIFAKKIRDKLAEIWGDGENRKDRLSAKTDG